MKSMESPPRTIERRAHFWIRVAGIVGVLFAVIVMHDVPSSAVESHSAEQMTVHQNQDSAAESQPSSDGRTGHHEGVFHLCIAILLGLVVAAGYTGTHRRLSHAALVDHGSLVMADLASRLVPDRYGGLGLLRC